MFLLETTPNTTGYMIAGFLVTFITMGIYIASVYIRNRNLKRDVEAIESMRNEKPKSTKKR